MVGALPGQPLADALEQAQTKLMDDPRTSHPFYWAAFIILGDGAKPLDSDSGDRVDKHQAGGALATRPLRRPRISLVFAHVCRRGRICDEC